MYIQIHTTSHDITYIHTTQAADSRKKNDPTWSQKRNNKKLCVHPTKVAGPRGIQCLRLKILKASKVHKQNLLPKARYVASQPKCDEDVTQGWEFLLINLWWIEWLRLAVYYSRQIPKVVPFMANSSDASVALIIIPVVPHEAVAEVSRIGILGDWLWAKELSNFFGIENLTKPPGCSWSVNSQATCTFCVGISKLALASIQQSFSICNLSRWSCESGADISMFRIDILLR